LVSELLCNFNIVVRRGGRAKFTKAFTSVLVQHINLAMLVFAGRISRVRDALHFGILNDNIDLILKIRM
jgi:hypothetical protein